MLTIDEANRTILYLIRGLEMMEIIHQERERESVGLTPESSQGRFNVDVAFTASTGRGENTFPEGV